MKCLRYCLQMIDILEYLRKYYMVSSNTDNIYPVVLRVYITYLECLTFFVVPLHVIRYTSCTITSHNNPFVYLYVCISISSCFNWLICHITLKKYIYIHFTSHNNIPLITSVDILPLILTPEVVENCGYCIYSIGLKCH